MPAIKDIVDRTKTYLCLDCGKCTVNCPVALTRPEFAPRRFVKDILTAPPDKTTNEFLWSCLTCKACEERCPSGVRYADLIRELRTLNHSAIPDDPMDRKDTGPECSHGGVLHSVMRLMTLNQCAVQGKPSDKSPNRLDWLPPELKSPSSDILYFVGCAPYFDVVFAELGIKATDSALSALRLLHKLGVRPLVLEDEVCCGHDLLWTGDVANFRKLAQHNLAAIKKSGAKKVVFNCPECYRTFNLDYPAYFGNLSFEVMHLTELLMEPNIKAKLNFRTTNQRVSYHDPCRLGRHLGVYEPPRDILKNIPGVTLLEMAQNRQNALCCGTANWISCNSYAKAIQLERLRQAQETGAELLLTSCPKCQIHLQCALKGEPTQGVKIKDISEFLESTLQ